MVKCPLTASTRLIWHVGGRLRRCHHNPSCRSKALPKGKSTKPKIPQTNASCPRSRSTGGKGGERSSTCPACPAKGVTSEEQRSEKEGKRAEPTKSDKEDVPKQMEPKDVESGRDYWTEDKAKGTWTRHHISLRDKLFVPGSVAGVPKLISWTTGG